jgi:hypothetical protein
MKKIYNILSDSRIPLHGAALRTGGAMGSGFDEYLFVLPPAAFCGNFVTQPILHAGAFRPK